jgi:hypothetical protein
MNYLQKKLWIKYTGASADPVRDHTKCYDSQGRIILWPKYLVPKAHSDDFSTQDRIDMGIMSAEEMANIFSRQKKVSEVFHFPLSPTGNIVNR